MPQSSSKSKLERLSPVENLCLGCLAGIGSKSINYPLLVFKNYSQQSLGMPRLVPWVLYRGLPMACLNLGGTTAVQFGFTGVFQKMLRPLTGSDTAVQFGGSFLGGLASGLPCSLWELTMIQQQRFGGSLVSVPARIWTEYGLKGMLRGVTMTLGRESLFTLSMLGLTPAIQRELVQKSGLDSSSALAAGALSGAIVSATLTHPMDTIKTCLQGDLAGEKYTSNAQAYAALVKNAGSFTGLFKGLNWRIALIATTFFLVNDFKERLAPLLYPRLLKDDD